MRTKLTADRSRNDVVQLSVFAENKIGCLNLVLQRLMQSDVHILAMCCIDQTDCAVLRIIPNYPDVAEKVLHDAQMAVSQCNVLALELSQSEDLVKITQLLAQTEINIHYLYPSICRPGGKSGIMLACDDTELAAQVLSSHGISVLDLNDLAR